MQIVIYLVKVIISLTVYYIAGISINLHEVLDLRKKLKARFTN